VVIGRVSTIFPSFFFFLFSPKVWTFYRFIHPFFFFPGNVPRVEEGKRSAPLLHPLPLSLFSSSGTGDEEEERIPPHIFFSLSFPDAEEY